MQRKKRIIRRTLTISIAGLFFPASLLFAQTKFIAYQVQPGESLSSILYNRFNLTPIYGKNGVIQKVLQLNPGKTSRGGDYILASTVLIIPVPKTSRLASVEERSEMSEPTTLPVKEEVPRPELVAAADVNEDSGAYANLDVSLGAAYLGIFGVEKSHHSKGTLSSGLSPKIRISWWQHWNQNLSTKLYFKGMDVQFRAESSGIQIKNDRNFNAGFGLGFSEKLTSGLSVLADLEVLQALFYRGLSDGGVELNQVPIFSFHPQVQYSLLQKTPFVVFVILGGSYFFASSYGAYSIDPGWGLNAAFGISQEFQSTKANCEIGYQQKKQDTSLLEFEEKNLGFECALSWRLE